MHLHKMQICYPWVDSKLGERLLNFWFCICRLNILELWQTRRHQNKNCTWGL